MPKDSLKQYKTRRNLKKSGEPSGNKTVKIQHPLFVIQKHNASHLHYDFRLEVNGVLKSWAVPKGPSLNPTIKRLAAPTDDHPMDYATFEGIIPEGNYGAGQVIVWDIGAYENMNDSLSMADSIKKGKIKIFLHGKKLQGLFELIKTKIGWLLFKIDDEYAHKKSNPLTSMPESVLSGQTIQGLQKKTKNDTVDAITVGGHEIAISNPRKLLFTSPPITKLDVVEYYKKIAPYMLAYTKQRCLSMQRFPQGIDHEGFYQKDAGSYFPEWIPRFDVEKKEGGIVHHVVVNNAATLVYLATQAVLVFHMWLSKITAINKPDRIIFDLDPSRNNFDDIRYAALQLKKGIEHLGLVPFVMTTGSRGLHVVVPIKPEFYFDQVRAFAYDLARLLVHEHSKILTLEVRKEKREGKIFVDYLRNSSTATSVAPYSLRARPGAPVATPLEWPEVQKKTLKPDMYTISTIFKRLASKGDPWKTINKSSKSLKKPLKLIKKYMELL